jgi:hypothetical protein
MDGILHCRSFIKLRNVGDLMSNQTQMGLPRQLGTPLAKAWARIIRRFRASAEAGYCLGTRLSK